MGFENYDDFTVARSSALAVLQAIPVVGGVAQVTDAYLEERARRQRQERLDTFLDELETGARDLTRDVARTEPLVHAASVTLDAALRTGRKEKIRWFARLLLAGLGEEPKLDLEREHETYLKMPDELSHQEMALLTILTKYEADEREERIYNYWTDFIRDIERRYSIPEDEVYALLARLVRTGAYAFHEGGPRFGVVEHGTKQGTTTRLYERLAEMIQVQGEELLG